ncbi:hypothetical protein D3C72_387310 [compost metagenome]
MRSLRGELLAWLLGPNYRRCVDCGVYTDVWVTLPETALRPLCRHCQSRELAKAIRRVADGGQVDG